MVFLGMTRRPQTAKEHKDPNNPLRYMARISKTRREDRVMKKNQFEEEKKSMFNDILLAEEDDIVE
jgi:hypothetical protein